MSKGAAGWGKEPRSRGQEGGRGQGLGPATADALGGGGQDVGLLLAQAVEHQGRHAPHGGVPVRPAAPEESRHLCEGAERGGTGGKRSASRGHF